MKTNMLVAYVFAYALLPALIVMLVPGLHGRRRLIWTAGVILTSWIGLLALACVESLRDCRADPD